MYEILKYLNTLSAILSRNSSLIINSPRLKGLAAFYSRRRSIKKQAKEPFFLSWNSSCDEKIAVVRMVLRGCLYRNH